MTGISLSSDLYTLNIFGLDFRYTQSGEIIPYDTNWRTYCREGNPFFIFLRPTGRLWAIASYDQMYEFNNRDFFKMHTISYKISTYAYYSDSHFAEYLLSLIEIAQDENDPGWWLMSHTSHFLE